MAAASSHFGPQAQALGSVRSAASPSPSPAAAPAQRNSAQISGAVVALILAGILLATSSDDSSYSGPSTTPAQGPTVLLTTEERSQREKAAAEFETRLAAKSDDAGEKQAGRAGGTAFVVPSRHALVVCVLWMQRPWRVWRSCTGSWVVTRTPRSASWP